MLASHGSFSVLILAQLHPQTSTSLVSHSWCERLEVPVFTVPTVAGFDGPNKSHAIIESKSSIEFSEGGLRTLASISKRDGRLGLWKEPLAWNRTVSSLAAIIPILNRANFWRANISGAKIGSVASRRKFPKGSTPSMRFIVEGKQNGKYENETALDFWERGEWITGPSQRGEISFLGFGKSNYAIKETSMGVVAQVLAGIPEHCIYLNFQRFPFLRPTEGYNSGFPRPFAFYFENEDMNEWVFSVTFNGIQCQENITCRLDVEILDRTRVWEGTTLTFAMRTGSKFSRRAVK